MYDTEIRAASVKHSVPEEVIRAIIQIESGWQPKAFREEPGISDASRGLMQILLKTARWLGFKGMPEMLFDPGTNIDLGTQYLRWQLTRYDENVFDAAAAYNAGTRFKKDDGTYINQRYVDRFRAAYEAELKKKVEDKCS